MSPSYEGRCHCGALGFSYTTDLPANAWAVRACQCSFCRVHGARCASDPNGSVRFHIAKPDALVRYSFALRTAEFLLCGICGAYLAAVLSARRGRFATVNLNTLTRAIPELPSAEPVSYESESREQRVARRESRWTPVLGAVQQAVAD
jgi:hypothetical protein